MKRSSDLPWRFGLFLATYYLANAVYQGYAAKYFEAVGMSHSPTNKSPQRSSSSESFVSTQEIAAITPKCTRKSAMAKGPF